MQLPLFLLVDLLHTRRFEQRVAALGRVRLEKRALIEVGSTDVNILLWDVVQCKLFGLLALLGSIFCQLNTKKEQSLFVMLNRHSYIDPTTTAFLLWCTPLV